ncbi:uncharacterized protein si:ch73-364h19.1 isoform X2 [Erpetoichthys calabaricus]|uniref:uncharacterized protein si:ch73-364h19.1 isoform X2 n=1 Tax=Erpetoichthys calabaricus TaxID=27687 RepID=UPI0022341DF7|nr:uncharacterized protein si:ch73-364h19.1 isoform X2 [Erpetoichthys calabaricus]
MSAAPPAPSVTPTVAVMSALGVNELTVVIATSSCMIFFIIIMVLLIIMYQKDPLCCKARHTGGRMASQQYPEAPPSYFSSSQNLMSSRVDLQSPPMAFDNPEVQGGQLFLIGPPESYHLPPLEPPLPRLPSYESVRKKDRQQHIHKMIADRFGLVAPSSADPPSYEESIRSSVAAEDEHQAGDATHGTSRSPSASGAQNDPVR